MSWLDAVPLPLPLELLDTAHIEWGWRYRPIEVNGMVERITRDRSFHIDSHDWTSAWFNIGSTFWLLAAGRKVRIHNLLNPEKPFKPPQTPLPPPKLTLGLNFTVSLNVTLSLSQSFRIACSAPSHMCWPFWNSDQVADTSSWTLTKRLFILGAKLKILTSPSPPSCENLHNHITYWVFIPYPSDRYQ